MAFQDTLYTLEVGKGKRFIQLGAIFIGFIFLALLYFVLIFRGFYHVGAMDSAQLGRQLATGQGFTTKLVRPAALRQFADYYNSPAMAKKGATPKIDVFNLPDISNAPVYPAVLSVLFRIPGINFEPTPSELGKSQLYDAERRVVFFGQFCVFLTAVVLFFWAWRMFDDRVAFVATTAFVGCDLIWQFSLSGLATSWIMLLMTALCGVVHEILIAEEEDRRTAVWGWTLSSAVLLSLIILSRLSLGWLLIPYGFLLLISLRRLVFPPLVAIALVILCLCPWYFRVYKLCGNPLGTSMSQVADKSPEVESLGERSFDPSGGLPVKRGLHKIFEGFGYSLSNFFILEGSSVVTLLFGAAFLHRFKRQRTQYMRWFLVGAALAIVFGSSLLWVSPKPTDEANYLVLLFPGFAAVGAAFFYVLLDRLDLGLQILRYIVVTIFLIVCSIPLIITLLPPGPPNFRYPPYFPPMIRYITQLLKPDEFLVSDIASATAWYGNRSSLWMPSTLKGFYEINDTVQVANGMLLTPLSWDTSLYQIDKGFSKDWAPILRRQGLPTGFPLTAYTAMPPLDNEYLFFSDRRRW